ncbi:hypothetical protein C2S51_026689 [Perilla frutescens var. frutescens]|nr:hypothetical protein C2S51_026689 [Perilla frutescens var. frutescens]
MTRSFNPCINYLTTGSTASSPTEACCTSLRNLMSNGQDCLCLIVTGGVPLHVPLNRPLAMSLPRACKMSGVAVECKATASPVEAPDLGESSPSMSPWPSPPSPRASSISELPAPSLPPESDLEPALTPPGMRPTLFPSAAHSSHSALPSLFAMLGVFLFHCY